jgi:hypothetical protein
VATHYPTRTLGTADFLATERRGTPFGARSRRLLAATRKPPVLETTPTPIAEYGRVASTTALAPRHSLTASTILRTASLWRARYGPNCSGGIALERDIERQLSAVGASLVRHFPDGLTAANSRVSGRANSDIAYTGLNAGEAGTLWMPSWSCHRAFAEARNRTSRGRRTHGRRLGPLESKHSDCRCLVESAGATSSSPLLIRSAIRP